MEHRNNPPTHKIRTQPIFYLHSLYYISLVLYRALNHPIEIDVLELTRSTSSIIISRLNFASEKCQEKKTSSPRERRRALFQYLEVCRVVCGPLTDGAAVVSGRGVELA